MNKFTILILSLIVFCIGCNNQDEKKPESDILIEQLLPETDYQNSNQEENKNDINDTVEYINEDAEDLLYEDEKVDSSGYFIAFFESASMVEAEIGLHFIEDGTGKNIDFYTIDIDPEEERVIYIYRN